MASGINSTFRQVGIATGHRRAGRRLPAQRHPRHHRRAAWRAGTRARSLSAAHGQLGTLLESGEVTQIAQLPLPGRARRRWITPTAWASPARSRRSPLIAAVIALVGAVLAFVLVRSRDFVSAGELPGRRRRSPSLMTRRELRPRDARSSPRRDAIGPQGASPRYARAREHRQPRIARISWVRRASARTARTPTRACCAPDAGARTCRTTRSRGPGCGGLRSVQDMTAA